MSRKQLRQWQVISYYVTWVTETFLTESSKVLELIEFQPLNIFGMHPWGYTIESTGDVVAVEFNKDGDSIAVAYRKGGVAVFNIVLGCRTLSTFAQVLEDSRRTY